MKRKKNLSKYYNKEDYFLYFFFLYFTFENQ